VSLWWNCFPADQALAQSLHAVFADAGAEEVGRAATEDFAASELERLEDLSNVRRTGHGDSVAPQIRSNGANQP
jgi:hypothetical protein